MSKRKTTETKYVIVTFEDDNECSIEVIPALWLSGADQAWWPSHVGSMQRIGELIKKCAQPNEALWERLKVRVLGHGGESL